LAGSDDLAKLLAGVPIFKGLEPKTLKSVIAEGRERAFKQGESMVGEGKTGIGFYLILEGRAEVRKGARVLSTLGQGQFFGEMSVIDGEPRSADVVALEPTTCWVLTAWNFAGLLKSHPEIAVTMLKEMVKRLRASQSSQAS
jgi:CRP/FNR family transcriptional regulator, cyclic AMP receptor protein